MKYNNCDPKIEYFEGIKILVKLQVEFPSFVTLILNRSKEKLSDKNMNR